MFKKTVCFLVVTVFILPLGACDKRSDQNKDSVFSGGDTIAAKSQTSRENGTVEKETKGTDSISLIEGFPEKTVPLFKKKTFKMSSFTIDFNIHSGEYTNTYIAMFYSGISADKAAKHYLELYDEVFYQTNIMSKTHSNAGKIGIYETYCGAEEQEEDSSLVTLSVHMPEDEVVEQSDLIDSRFPEIIMYDKLRTLISQSLIYSTFTGMEKKVTRTYTIDDKTFQEAHDFYREKLGGIPSTPDSLKSLGNEILDCKVDGLKVELLFAKGVSIAPPQLTISVFLK